MPINVKPILTELALVRPITKDEMRDFFEAILEAEVTPAQIGAFLMGLEVAKINATDTLIAGATAMRSKMIRLDLPFETIDVVGTGGDGAHSLNISTATAFVAAAAGLKIAKHGNRSMSSICGSADVLEELGVKLTTHPATQTKALEDANLAFFFAPNYHPKMAYVGPLRRELGFGTAFNIMGPLCNPTSAARQLLGVYRPELLLPIAETLRELGSKSAWVIHGLGGLDEAVLHGATQVVELRDGKLREFEISPSDCNLPYAPLETLKGGDPKFNANALLNLLRGDKSEYRDAVVLNAACTFVMAGIESDLKTAAQIAIAAIDSGKAMNILQTLKAITNE